MTASSQRWSQPHWPSQPPSPLQQAAEKAATIGMTPDQARALAQGIIAAADRAEGKQ